MAGDPDRADPAPVPPGTIKLLTKIKLAVINKPMKTVPINSETELYCILGNPVRHSVSPIMHNAAFDEAGINAVYLAFEPATITAAVSSMKALPIKGASVTIPYKIEVIRHCDRMDPLAADIGSVNTLVNNGGIITGFNTDGFGALRALELARVDVSNSRCLLIGNGGSARAIGFTLAAGGASVTVAGRDRARIDGFAADLRVASPSARSILLKEIDRGFMGSIDIIINATPVGMQPDINSAPIDLDLISPQHTVFDIVYAPHMTRLLEAARERGAAIVHGIDMLVYQGARQFELWTGKPAPVEVMRSAIHGHLQHKQ
jgi:shikimate dehydrogenase